MWFSVVCTLFDHCLWRVSLSTRVQITLNYIPICFFTTISTSNFFQSASWKRHCTTHWRQQRCLDSYRQRHISQSDCKISSNCGKKKNRFHVAVRDARQHGIYLCTATQCWSDETQPGRDSCPRLQFLASSLDPIMSLCSNQPCFH